MRRRQGGTRPDANFLDAFSNVGRPNNRVRSAIRHSSPAAGTRSSRCSARWVFPDDGFEAYTEWARLEFPYSFRDLLIAPNHSQGYTLGLQYARPAFTAGGRFRVAGRGHFASSRARRGATGRRGSFYTSRKVIQGYTQMGQPLAAGIGPGAQVSGSRWTYIEPSWSFGIFAGRIRWNEDIHSTYGFPLYQGYCIHDVSVFPGARGSASSRFGLYFGRHLLSEIASTLFSGAVGMSQGQFDDGHPEPDDQRHRGYFHTWPVADTR